MTFSQSTLARNTFFQDFNQLKLSPKSLNHKITLSNKKTWGFFSQFQDFSSSFRIKTHRIPLEFVSGKKIYFKKYDHDSTVFKFVRECTVRTTVWWNFPFGLLFVNVMASETRLRLSCELHETISSNTHGLYKICWYRTAGGRSKRRNAVRRCAVSRDHADTDTNVYFVCCVLCCAVLCGCEAMRMQRSSS